jgi:hypothetical protein
VATLWVDHAHGSASDSTTKANNSASTPWLSLNRALWGNTNRAGSSTPSEAAAAGDTVYVVYDGNPYTFTSSVSGNAVQFQPANSGSAGNPIIIEAYGIPGGFGADWVELAPTGAGGGHVFGYVDETASSPGGITKGWVEWRGFRTDTGTYPDIGNWPCHFLGVRDVEVEYCKFDGGQTPTGGGSNHNATRFTYCRGYWVHNCYFTGFYAGGTGDENGNACEIYWSGGGIFEHNHVVDCANGWFPKAPNHVQDGTTNIWGALAPHVCRFNIFEDCYQCVTPHRVDNVASEDYGLRIYQNLMIRPRGTPVRIMTFSTDTYSPHHCKIFNNTIWSDSGSEPTFEVFTDHLDVIHADAGVVSMNNIIKLAVSIEGFHGAGAVTAYNDLDSFHSNRNCWDIPLAASGNFFQGGGNASYTTWRAQGQDADSGSGRTTVTFESAGTDFRLTANGQTALTMGRALYDIGGATGATIPCGCYITGDEEIGIEAFADEEESSPARIVFPFRGMARRR